jgi:acyl transferase domain-containing protein
MKRIGLTGAMLALLLFGTSTGAYALQENQDKEHGNKHDKQNKDEKDKKKADKDKGDAEALKQQQAQQAAQAQQQALQAQQAQAAQAAAQAAQQHPPQPQPAVVPPGRQRVAQHGATDQANAQQRQQELARQQEQARLQQQNQANQQQQAAQQQIAIEQQRAAQYQNTLEQQVRAVQAQNAQLQQENRRSQYQIQQQYAQALQEQQQRIRNEQNYNYNSDPFYRTRSTYRYVINGQTRRTNRYGADVLRQAVNYGYDQGYRAGEADRMDHWKYKYQDAFAYRDANYGYPGRYVSQSDYNYYFRQGFRRGYEDAYYRRAKYGRRSNGKTTIFSVTISGILNLRVIR